MEFRHHPGVVGKRDAYPFDPRLLKIDSGYNVRNLDDPLERDELDELKEQIRANGVRTPLEVRLAGDDVIIVAGHRRHKVVMELIEEGEDIKAVPVLPEPKGTGEADRIVNLVISNSGKPLKPLEIAEVIRRLVAFGWEKQQIAQRLGWKSASSINQYLDMLAMPEGVKEHVRKGEVSATLARKIVKESGPEETPEDRIKANLEENRRIRGKVKKVTPKTLKRDAEKKKAEQRKLSSDISVSGGTASETDHQRSAISTLPADQQPAARLELPPASVPQALQQPNPNYPDREIDPETAASMNAAAAELHQATLAKVEEHNDWHPDKEPEAQTQFSREGTGGGAAPWIKSLIDALEPFAAAVELNALGERPDEDVVEVPIRDLKRAWRAYTAATGGQS